MVPWKKFVGFGCVLSGSIYSIQKANAIQAPTKVHGDKIVIVGAGIGGLAAANALRAQGFSVEVFEKARALLPVGATLALSPNGVAALEAISPDACDRILAQCITPEVCVIRDMNNEVVKKTSFIRNKARLLVWHILQSELARGLPVGCLHLDRTFSRYDVDPKTREVTVVFKCGDGSEEVVRANCLIGADGVNSAVRLFMHGEDPQKINHDKIMFRANLSRKNVESLLPNPHEIPGEGVQFSWSRSPGELFSFREAGQDSLTFTAINYFGHAELIENSTEIVGPSQAGCDKGLVKRASTLKRRLGGRKAILQKTFETYPPAVQRIIDVTPEEAIYVNEVMDHQVSSRWVDGPVALIGDAVHTMTPDAGQGANMALEDAAELAAFLSRGFFKKDFLSRNFSKEEKWGLERGLALWEKERKPRVERVGHYSRQLTAEHNPVNTPGSVDQPNPDFFDYIYAYRPSLTPSRVVER